MREYKRKMAQRRKKRWIISCTVILSVTALGLILGRCGTEDMIATEEQIAESIEALHSTPSPEPIPEDTIHILPSENVTLLAKIMAAEDGIGWPDWAIMAIGEVVLNRVASPEFPNTIRDVLYQTNPTQYSPVQDRSWDEAVADERYIELAERLLDGERVLDNPQIVYQALFEQGRGTVLSYRDIYLGTTTYFCLTDNPGMYQ